MFEVIYFADGKRARLNQSFPTRAEAMIEVRALWSVGINAWAEKV